MNLPTDTAIPHNIVFHYIDENQAIPIIKEYFRKKSKGELKEEQIAPDYQLIRAYKSHVLRIDLQKEIIISAFSNNLKREDISYSSVFQSLRWTFLKLVAVPHLIRATNTWTSPEKDGPFLMEGLNIIDLLTQMLDDFEENRVGENSRVIKWVARYMSYLDRMRQQLHSMGFDVKQRQAVLRDLAGFLNSNDPVISVWSEEISGNGDLDEAIDAPVINHLSDRYLLLVELGIRKFGEDVFEGNDPKAVARIVGALLDLTPTSTLQIAKIHGQFGTGGSNDPIKSKASRKRIKKLLAELGIKPVELEDYLS